MSYAINLDLGQLSNNSAIRFRRCAIQAFIGSAPPRPCSATNSQTKKGGRKWQSILLILRQTANQEVNLPFINKIEKRITLLFRLLFSLSSLFTEHEKLTYLLSIS